MRRQMDEDEAALSLYRQAAEAFGPAILRTARAFEADAELALDLAQDIHVALWRSFAAFDGRCSLKTWVYRVANNVAASHVRKQAGRLKLVGLEAAEPIQADHDPERRANDAQMLGRLHALLLTLKPIDRQVVLLHLEDLDPAEIADVTGLSAGNVAVKLHRIRKLLTARLSPAPEATP